MSTLATPTSYVRWASAGVHKAVAITTLKMKRLMSAPSSDQKKSHRRDAEDADRICCHRWTGMNTDGDQDEVLEFFCAFHLWPLVLLSFSAPSKLLFILR